jgi:hypothetical protein
VFKPAFAVALGASGTARGLLFTAAEPFRLELIALLVSVAGVLMFTPEFTPVLTPEFIDPDTAFVLLVALTPGLIAPVAVELTAPAPLTVAGGTVGTTGGGLLTGTGAPAAVCRLVVAAELVAELTAPVTCAEAAAVAAKNETSARVVRVGFLMFFMETSV